MIRNANLTKRKNLQSYAIVHANYIRNRTVLFDRDGVQKTRYEWQTGEKPDLSNEPTWGCAGYMRIPDKDRDKVASDKARECFYLGHDIDGKSVLVYVPSLNAVRETGDFVYDEVKTFAPIGAAPQPDDTIGEKPLTQIHTEDHDLPAVVGDNDNEDEEEQTPCYEKPKIGKRVTRSMKHAEDNNQKQHAQSTVSIFSNNGYHPPKSVALVREAFDFVNTAVQTRSLEDLLTQPGAEGEKWQAAAQREYKSHAENNCYEVAIAPDGFNIFKPKTVCAIKSDGTYKVRVTIAAWNAKYGKRQVKDVLGMNVSKISGGYALDMEQYIDTMLEKFGMTDSRDSTIPMCPGLKLSSEQCPNTEGEKQKMRSTPIDNLLGLNYIQQLPYFQRSNQRCPCCLNIWKIQPHHTGMRQKMF